MGIPPPKPKQEKKAPPKKEPGPAVVEEKPSAPAPEPEPEPEVKEEPPAPAPAPAPEPEAKEEPPVPAPEPEAMEETPAPAPMPEPEPEAKKEPPQAPIVNTSSTDAEKMTEIVSSAASLEVSPVAAEAIRKSLAAAPLPADVDLSKGACYITFDTASDGTLFTTWSKTPVDGAFAVLRPHASSKIPGYLASEQSKRAS